MNDRIARALACALLFVPLLGATQQQDGSANGVTHEGAPAVQAQRVYLDPITGRLTDTPPPGVEVLTLSPEELNSLSTSHDGLVMTPLPGGGYAVDLKGRFRHLAVARIAPDGTVVIRDVAGEAFLPPAPPISGTKTENK